jgi:hypothetical protein
MMDGAVSAKELLGHKSLVAEDETIMKMTLEPLPINSAIHNPVPSQLTASRQDMIVSFRGAFRGFIISLVDSAPSEICVISLNNINAIASWDFLRSAGSTMYVTVSSLQVDNMVPNAPFPVAVAPTDLAREALRIVQEGDDCAASSAPLLVIGVSAAPKHSTGVLCFKSVTVAPRNLSVFVDLAFLVRLQKSVLTLSLTFVATTLLKTGVTGMYQTSLVRLKKWKKA